jgi:hypothetical protein
MGHGGETIGAGRGLEYGSPVASQSWSVRKVAMVECVLAERLNRHGRVAEGGEPVDEGLAREPDFAAVCEVLDRGECLLGLDPGRLAVEHQADRAGRFASRRAQHLCWLLASISIERVCVTSYDLQHRFAISLELREGPSAAASSAERR